MLFLFLFLWFLPDAVSIPFSCWHERKKRKEMKNQSASLLAEMKKKIAFIIDMSKPLINSLIFSEKIVCVCVSFFSFTDSINAIFTKQRNKKQQLWLTKEMFSSTFLIRNREETDK